MNPKLTFAVALFSTVLPGVAEAQARRWADQTWLYDRRYGEGIGVRMGNLELHPGIAGEVGYDTNYFQRAHSEGVIDAYRLRLTPSLSLSTLGPQRSGSSDPGAISFRGTAYAAYNELIAADSQYSDEVADERHVALGTRLNLSILPEKPWGSDLRAQYARVAEPSNAPGDDFAFDRGTGLVGGDLVWRPGGGLLDWRLGYDFIFNYFEADTYGPLNNYQHRIKTEGRWRFLPRTALLYQGSYTLVRYTHDASPANGEILAALVGARGLVTRSVGLLGMVGWGATFYDGVPEDADTLLARAEVAYYFVAGQAAAEEGAPGTGPSALALGYDRSINNSYLSSFYRRDRIYAHLSYFFGGVMLVSAEGGLSLIHFPPGGQVNALDQRRWDVRLYAEYRLSDVVGILGTVRYDRNASDTPTGAGGAPDPGDDLDYSRWQAFLGVRAFL